MPSIAIATTPDGNRVYSGMEWALLPRSGSDSDLREIAKERDASYAVCVKDREIVEYPEDVENIYPSEESEDEPKAGLVTRFKGAFKSKKKSTEVRRVKAGFYQAIEKPPTRKSYSIAVAFAEWAHETPNVCIHLKVKLLDKDDYMHMLVVCVNGVPMVDTLYKSPEQARAVVLQYRQTHIDMEIWSDNEEMYPTALTADDLLARIVASIGKSALLKPIPPNTVAIAFVCVVVAAAYMGYAEHKKAEAEKKRQAEIQARIDSDPKPKYMAALAIQRTQAGEATAALLDEFNFALRIKYIAGGWEIRKLECGLAAQGCLAQYARTNGTYLELVKDVTTLGLVPTEKLGLTEATMAWKKEPVYSELPLELPDLDTFIQKEPGSKLQTWMTAGLSIQLGPPMLWPKVPTVPDTFKDPNAVASGTINVAMINLAQLAELIRTPPSNVLWNGFVLDFTPSGKVGSMTATAKLNGVFYVKR